MMNAAYTPAKVALMETLAIVRAKHNHGGVSVKQIVFTKGIPATVVARCLETLESRSVVERKRSEKGDRTRFVYVLKQGAEDTLV